MHFLQDTASRTAALLALAVTLSAAAGTTLYVSPKGDDSWTVWTRTGGPIRAVENGGRIVLCGK